MESTGKSLESFELNYDGKNSENNKETYLRNELTRMVKENTSLRVNIYFYHSNLIFYFILFFSFL